MRDLASDLAPVQVFGPAVLNADQTAVEVDLQGFHGAVVLIQVGVGGITFDATNKIEFTLRHKKLSTDTYADVGVSDLVGKDKPASVGATGIVKALTAAHAAAAVYEIGYVGGRRYLEVDIEFSGTHGTGTPIAITVIKGNPEIAPAA